MMGIRGFVHDNTAQGGMRMGAMMVAYRFSAMNPKHKQFLDFLQSRS
jgi:hypothetical protein